MTLRDKLWELIAALVNNACNIQQFCDDFSRIYNLEIDYKILSDEEKDQFGDLCDMADRFSDDEDDLALPNVYFSEKQIRDRAQEIYQSLKRGEKTTEAPGKTKYKTFAEVLEAFTGNHVDPEELKLTDEDRRKFDELEKKLAKLSPEERKKALRPRPEEIDDFFI